MDKKEKPLKESTNIKIEEPLPIKKQKKPRPSFKIELLIALGLIFMTIAGVFHMLGSYLSNSFNSLFGMGLK